ncbi:MAG: GIY-YIG nuclease family protein [Candidatus Omnitrophica bacterium]|nr:GIY-YIG nuclease family protein [Candidatus Omnitrophota bacterium]
MFYVYVLQSIKDDSQYIGLSQDPAKRLKEHNQGDSKYTKGHRPYKLIYQEFCETRQEARVKEKFYKSGVGREKLKNIILL